MAKNTISIRQKKYIDSKKSLGFKKIQIYISENSYNELLFLKNNGLTFSQIIEKALSVEYKKLMKKSIKKDKYDF